MLEFVGFTELKPGLCNIYANNFASNQIEFF